MSTDHQEVIIHYQPIELCKLLKIANLVGGGGEAKIVITQGYVLLNGEVEFQKRKKIVSGDIVEFNGDIIKVVYKEKPKEQQKPLSNINIKKQKINKGETNVSPNSKIELKKNSRKPISF
jgi:ribosome-associated protein